MAVIRMFSVFDRKVEAFLPPFPARTVGEAIRMFTDTVQDDKSMLFRYPEDYFLAEVGTFDDVAGVYLDEKNLPRQVVTALDCRSPG